MVFGVLNTIRDPKYYFDKHPREIDEVVEVVRLAFGRNLDFNDIYKHITSPQEVCLLRDDKGNLLAMRSQNRIRLSGIPSLILEGAAIHPRLQGRGTYGRLLSEIDGRENIICLRTQNPRVYAAVEKYCQDVYPKRTETPGAIREIQRALATELGCTMDDKGVVKGYYGGLFYGDEPLHWKTSSFFKEDLGMELHRGDAVLVVGVK